MMDDKLTAVQAKRLLRFHLTGDPGGGRWETMKALEMKGYITLGQKITLTEKGKQWCEDNHMKGT